MKHHFFTQPRFVFFELPSSHEMAKAFEKDLQPAYDEASKVLLSERGELQEEFVNKNLAPIAAKKAEILAKIEEPEKKIKTERARIILGLAENYVSIKFREHVRKAQEELEEAQAEVNRGIFIDDKTSFILDDKTRETAFAILKGLLGGEKDENKWEEIYQSSFGWLDSYTEELTMDLLAEKFPLKVMSEDVDHELDPEVNFRINAMIARAESLYGEDKAFIEQYRNYLLFTAHELGTKVAVTDYIFEMNAMSPEKYHKLNFTGFAERPKEGMSGSQFAMDVLGLDLKRDGNGVINWKQLGKLSPDEIQNAILMQIEIGNIPDFLRIPKPVRIPTSDGGSVTVYAMPDVMAVGSDEDYIRVPMTPVLSQALAQKYGLALPTKTILENTYEEAGRTGKQCTGPNYSQTPADSPYLNSAGYYVRQSRAIDEQLKGVEPGTLVSGGKKELAASGNAASGDGKITFYGLRMADGKPIQVNPAHGGTEGGYRHTEYAMGTRFYAEMIVVTDKEGKERVISMREALMDKNLAAELNKAEYQIPPGQPESSSARVRIMASMGPFDPDDAYNAKKHKQYNITGLQLPV